MLRISRHQSENCIDHVERAPHCVGGPGHVNYASSMERESERERESPFMFNSLFKLNSIEEPRPHGGLGSAEPEHCHLPRRKDLKQVESGMISFIPALLIFGYRILGNGLAVARAARFAPLVLLNSPTSFFPKPQAQLRQILRV